MINQQVISGLVLVSDGEFGCYPYLESLKSFLPIVDELVVLINRYPKKDGTIEKLQELQKQNKKIRLVPVVFDIEKYHWAAYGIARGWGYQACKGDVVLMFDCDGVLHEKEEVLLRNNIGHFINEGWATGYWEKHRLYKPELYYPQHKHSGIYSKKLLGDRLDFLRDDEKGAPNFDRLAQKEQHSYKFSVTLFGYEHVWDTEEVLRYKVNRYGVMLDTIHRKSLRTSDEYFNEYMKELVVKVNKDGKHMPLEKHTKIMQEKVRNVTEEHFGFNFFDYK